MDRQALYLERWRQLSEWEQMALAQMIQPTGFSFDGVEPYELGGQANRIAFYRWRDGARFALIPGSESAELGYNPATMEQPARAIFDLDLESMRTVLDLPPGDELAATMYFPYLKRLTPLRSAPIVPFLCEVKAVKYRDGVVHAEVQAQAAADGFHLLLPDEWEFACAAETRTLFRWGNDMPMVTYPMGEDHLRQSLLQVYPDGQFPPEYADCLVDWNLYKLPNAFGLQMPDDPYNWELTALPGIMRGGDGGGAICGGMGLFAEWIALASAYEDDWRASYQHYGKVYGAGLRRGYHLTD